VKGLVYYCTPQTESAPTGTQIVATGVEFASAFAVGSCSGRQRCSRRGVRQVEEVVLWDTARQLQSYHGRNAFIRRNPNGTETPGEEARELTNEGHSLSITG
jgi:hypothetical protein